MYSIYDLALLIPVILLVIYWWRSSEQHRVAVAAAREYCRERDLQLLDETLQFRRMRVEKDGRGQKRLCRLYEFDYSIDGKDRHTGEILLSAYTVLRVILHSHALEITEYSR
jgi:hypothetical protein